jgi:hypothetical protein
MAMTRGTCPICSEHLLGVDDTGQLDLSRYRCAQCGEFDMEPCFASSFGERARAVVPAVDLELLTRDIHRSNRDGVVPVLGAGLLADGHD